MNRSAWTISNFLSIVRILLVVPICLLIFRGDPDGRLWTVGLIVAAGITDLLDGWLARRLNQVSELGKIIDPLADKIAIAAVCTVLAIRELIPYWFFLIVIVRDLLIFFGGMYVRRSQGIILQSNYPGKWAAAVITVYILISVAGPSDLIVLKDVFQIASVLMLVISFTVYLSRFLSLKRSATSAG